jgi:hypothetical protein
MTAFNATASPEVTAGDAVGSCASTGSMSPEQPPTPKSKPMMGNFTQLRIRTSWQHPGR